MSALKNTAHADISRLVVNAYRGAAEKQSGFITFTPPPPLVQKGESRSVIRHDKSVFIDRGEGLLFVNKLNLVVDKLIVKQNDIGSPIPMSFLHDITIYSFCFPRHCRLEMCYLER
jgi:hypothetical protein